MVFYAGAALPQATWERLEAVAAACADEAGVVHHSWGSTETSPAITSAHWKLDRAGVIGLPLPGTELKFVPNGGKLEMRVRGVNVFPGYRDAPELTAQAFDAEGYYCIGDAGLLADARARSRAWSSTAAWPRTSSSPPAPGSAWARCASRWSRRWRPGAGRGDHRPRPQPRWVRWSSRRRRRAAAAGAAPAASPQALQALKSAALPRARRRPAVRSGCPITDAPAACCADRPPSADAGEITDKGYINQRGWCWRRRGRRRARRHASPGSIRWTTASAA
jgi:feruloyl-CoA synthase